MKKDIHPKYYPDAQVICSCGNTFTVGSTVPKIEVVVCSRCHPFWTGVKKLVDSEGLVDKFIRRRQAAAAHQETQKKKQEAKQEEVNRERQRPKSFKEMMALARQQLEEEKKAQGKEEPPRTEAGSSS